MTRRRLGAKGRTTYTPGVRVEANRTRCARPGCGHTWLEHRRGARTACKAFGCRCTSYLPPVEIL